MAEEKFRINDSGVDTDALREAIKDSAPSYHKETEDLIQGDLGEGSINQSFDPESHFEDPEISGHRTEESVTSFQDDLRDNAFKSEDVQEARQLYNQFGNEHKEEQQPMMGPMVGGQPMEQPMEHPMEQPMGQPLQKEQGSPLNNLKNLMLVVEMLNQKLLIWLQI